MPIVPPHRPAVYSQPFSTALVLDRNNDKWNKSLSQKYFLYPVHVSMAMMMTKGLDAALYLLLLRFLHRDYEEVFRLSESVSTDTAYSKAGSSICSALAFCNDDWHPDAHACRIRISLVTIDADMDFPWDLTLQEARHVVKLPHVSANCRLSLEEELQLLETEDLIVYETGSTKYRKRMHTPYVRTLVKNRLCALRGFLADTPQEEVVCFAPPREPLSAWPYYTDNTVFGQKYNEMVEITSEEDFETNLETQVVDGQTVFNPNGDLSVACFHVLWKKKCVKAMTYVTELASTYPACTFLNVRADSLELQSMAQTMGITNFPTFIVYRNGEKVDTISSSDRGVEETGACDPDQPLGL